jgi:hypothetical protein
MSIEGNDRSKDVEVARQMLEESDVLRDDGYARRVVESGGVADSGQHVDLGHFLAAREAALQENEAELTRLRGIDEEAVRQAMVVHSKPPELDNM